jgi:phage-related protein
MAGPLGKHRDAGVWHAVLVGSSGYTFRQAGRAEPLHLARGQQPKELASRNDRGRTQTRGGIRQAECRSGRVGSSRRIVELIQSYGLEHMREPHVKHLEGPLWEMRMKSEGGISRAIYVAAMGRRVVVVRVFLRRTQKTPRREIDLAMERAKEVTDNGTHPR